jgi:hypothetical protein
MGGGVRSPARVCVRACVRVRVCVCVCAGVRYRHAWEARKTKYPDLFEENH